MILKGQKVILRPIRLSDAARFVKWFNDPEFNKFMFLRRMTMRKEVEWIKKLSKARKTDLVLAIDTKGGEHIGSTGLNRISKEFKNATFGIMIGNKQYWNRGYGTDAARVILDYAFKKLKLHRVDLDVYEYNTRAIKVYKKLGFRVEGRRREHTVLDGKYYDTIHMGLLDKEWKA